MEASVLKVTPLDGRMGPRGHQSPDLAWLVYLGWRARQDAPGDG